MMEQRDVLKINRQLLMLTRQMAQDMEAAELMTGLPKAAIEKIACPKCQNEVEAGSDGTGTDTFSAVGRWRPDSECSPERE